MAESSDSHEFSDGWPSLSLVSSSSYEEDGESDLDEVLGEMGQTWSRNPQVSRELPRPWAGRRTSLAPQTRSESISPSLLQHDHSPRTALDTSRHPHYRQLDLPNFPLPTTSTVTTRSEQAPLNSLSRARNLPSSHLQLPRFSLGDEHEPQPLSRASSQSRRDSNASWSNWLSFPQSQGDFVDLTNETSPPTMPAARSKRRASRTVASDGLSVPAESSRKRKRTISSSKEGEGLKKELNDRIEGFDLTNVDDDTDLARVLQNQQEKAIKAQREELGYKPTKIAGLQCIICLETMKDVTATHCGKYWHHLEMRRPHHSHAVQVIFSATVVLWKLS